MLSPLLLSLHLNLPLVFSHFLQIPSLPWWSRWMLSPGVTQRTWLRFWQTKMSSRIFLLMFVLHKDIIKLVRTINLLSTSGLKPCLLVKFALFMPRVLLSSPGLFPRSQLTCTVWLLMSPTLLFRMPMRISFQMSELFLVPHFFDVDKKGAKKLWRSEDARSYFVFLVFSVFCFRAWKIWLYGFILSSYICGNIWVVM